MVSRKLIFITNSLAVDDKLYDDLSIKILAYKCAMSYGHLQSKFLFVRHACSPSDQVSVSHHIPQRLIYIAKMTTFKMYNENYTKLRGMVIYFSLLCFLAQRYLKKMNENKKLYEYQNQNKSVVFREIFMKQMQPKVFFLQKSIAI